MAVRKFSVSLSEELDEALSHVAASRGQPKSTVIETFLREHPVVTKYVAIVRSEPDAEVYAASRGREKAKSPRPRA